MKFVIATKNQKKKLELERILAPMGFEVLCEADLDAPLPEVEETGDTFEANALLKALEEPSPSSCFVLLAAQREQLLPTLVSRSLCLTLPWPDSLSRDPALQPWEEALALFITSGRGLFERTGARNALDARLAGQILLACQKSMSRVMSGNDDALCPLDTALALLPREKRVQCCFWFNEAQEALGFNVTPARVLEALAARLHVTRVGN